MKRAARIFFIALTLLFTTLALACTLVTLQRERTGSTTPATSRSITLRANHRHLYLSWESPAAKRAQLLDDQLQAARTHLRLAELVFEANTNQFENDPTRQTQWQQAKAALTLRQAELNQAQSLAAQNPRPWA